jgi:hypothetical protein
MIEIQETASFKIADQRIKTLLKRLEHLCPCCTAQALAFHAAFLAEQAMGSARTIEAFEDIISVLRKNDIPAPDPLPSTRTH